MKPTDFKKKTRLWLVCTAAYLTALGLLTLSERNAPDSSIQTFADAFWYSLVTMSTVGYGDLYPVTALGRILGTVFILFSLGLMTFLFSLLIQIVTGRMLPFIQLWMVRNKTWYIFSCQNPAAFTLAKDLVEQEDDCVLLFPKCADCVPPEPLPYLIYYGSAENLAAKKKDRCHICFMDDRDTYEDAVAALQTGHPIYCRTSFAPDIYPENLTLFNPCDCCARRYWQDHGLKQEEQTVILIGDGKYAENLLTQGLLLNVYAPKRNVSYHVFGNWEEYLRNHHQLAATLCLDGKNPSADVLRFHQTVWNEDPSLLAAADRIILCRDEQEDNKELLSQIHQYFPIKGEIHLLCRNSLPGQTVFGTQDTIFTAQLIFQEQLNQAARIMHQIYRDSSDADTPSWEQLSEFHRQSNIAAASHLLTKIRILLEDDTISAITPDNCRTAYARYCSYSPEQKEVCRQIEHQRWMRFHSMYNWHYSPVRNNTLREHPLMIPYEALNPRDQAKDDYAWELLDALSQQLKKA